MITTLLALILATPRTSMAWTQVNGGSHHDGIAHTSASRLTKIRWTTKVDEAPSGTVHYGAALVTERGTVIYPVKTGSSNGYRIDARSLTTGKLIYSVATDFVSQNYSWVSLCGPALTGRNELVIPGAAGTVLIKQNADDPDSPVTRVAPYGMENYTRDKTTLESVLKIAGSITTDGQGNIFYGYRATSTPFSYVFSSLVKIAPDRTAVVKAAQSCVPEGSLFRPTGNGSPAIGYNGDIYWQLVGTDSTNRTAGYLVRLNTSDLSVRNRVKIFSLRDSTLPAYASADSTSSPVVAPDFDVYVGTNSESIRGKLAHYNADLTVEKPSGAFGWDNTPSIVRKAWVPGYQGTSPYLLLCKYNYYGFNGQRDQVALLDPNATATDIYSGKQTMKIYSTMPSPTTTEWCIASAAVDPYGKCAFMNNENGILYKWDFVTNTLSEQIRMTNGALEAYTATAIAPNGYVIGVNMGQMDVIAGERPPVPGFPVDATQ